MGRELTTACEEVNNNTGFKYSISDVNLYMAAMKKDKSNIKKHIFLFDTFQHILSCNTVQHAKHLPVFLNLI